MNCFEDLIGVRGLCEQNSQAQLFIQDLPFMDIQTITGIMEHNKSIQEYVNERLNYCYNDMKNEINFHLMPYFRQNSLLENKVLGAYRENLAAQPAQSGIRQGVVLQIYDTLTYYEVVLNSISLWTTNYSGNVTIKVHNIITGEELDSFVIPVTPNTTTPISLVNKKYPLQKQKGYIMISYDTTGIDSVQSTVSTIATGCSTCTKGGVGSKYALWNAVSIPDASAKLFNNLSYPGNTAGLSVQYTLNCSKDSFICSMKDAFAWPLFHRLGADLCNEIINGSKRINSITTIDREKAQALKPDFEQVYKDSLASTLNMMQLPNDACLKCNQKIKVISRIP